MQDLDFLPSDKEIAEETRRARLRESNTRAAKTERVRQRNAQGQQKRKDSGWSKKMIGNQNGKNSKRFAGQRHTEETKELIRQKAIGRDHSSITGVPKPKATCPHCGKTGGRPQMIQYHFDKCKYK